MDELISVIVPVYKVEPFICHCVNSILNQTYRNLEIILVDDGSPDRCPGICDEFKRKDNRVQVIHQNNGGGGDARNKALDIARGEFIVFVDSDDYIESTMIEILYNQFQDEIDIVECDYCITEDDYAEFDLNDSKIKLFTASEAMRENINDRIFRQLIWNKMYRKSVIKDTRFPIDKKIDDEFWTYQVLGNARKLIYSGKKLYAYRQQPNSVMHLLNIEKRYQAVEAKIQRHKYICEKMPELESLSLNNLWFTCLYQGQLILQLKGKEEYQEIWWKLNRVFHNYPISQSNLKISIKQKFWLNMVSKSFYWTCWIRNFLRIGL